MPTYPHGFPDEVIDPFMNQTGRGVLGNVPASGTEIIQELGEEHQRTGKWIVYTSADSVFQIAAHEETIPLEELYEACRVAREILTGKHAVGRVIARPFVGEPGNYQPHGEPPRLLARAAAAELPLAAARRPARRSTASGRSPTSSPGCDIDESFPTKSNVEGIQSTEELLREIDDGFVFTNLVETDMLWGHRNDPENFHRCLQDFDRRLPDLLDALREGDLLILTSDHGCDPTTPSTDHSREYALLLAYVQGRNAAGRVLEGGEFADVGATVNAWLGGKAPVARHPGQADPRAVSVDGCDPSRRADPAQARRRGARPRRARRARARLRARRDPRLPAGGVLHGRLLPRALAARDVRADRRDDPQSGETIDLGAALGRKVVDKHSTGGVGDKTSLAVGPIVAACGVAVREDERPRASATPAARSTSSSRSPGFRVELSTDEFVDQVRDVGLAIVGQTADLVPADSMLYALRDVTATVDQLSLIAASIMSKKLAAGAQAIVLDVKVGDGAFMKTLDDARQLAEAMLALGEQAGREVVCLLTDMDQPLGAAVGNALEVREARATVRGEGPPDFTELVLDACARLLELSDLGDRPRRGLGAAPSARSPTARPRRCGAAGSRRRAARPTSTALERAPVVREVVARRAPGAVDAPRRDRGRATPRCTSAPAGGPRTTRSTTRSASSACASAATRSSEGEVARRGARARRRRPPRRGGRRGRRRVRARRRAASAARPDPARGHRLVPPASGSCPSCPRSRASGARLAPVLEGRRLERVEIVDVPPDAAARSRPRSPGSSRASASSRSTGAASI